MRFRGKIQQGTCFQYLCLAGLFGVFTCHAVWTMLCVKFFQSVGRKHGEKCVLASTDGSLRVWKAARLQRPCLSFSACEKIDTDPALQAQAQSGCLRWPWGGDSSVTGCPTTRRTGGRWKCRHQGDVRRPVWTCTRLFTTGQVMLTGIHDLAF